MDDCELYSIIKDIDEDLYNQKKQHQNFNKKLQRREDWGRSHLSDIRGKAKSKRKDFNLTHEDLVVPTHCPILGIELCVNNKSFQDNSPSVDRIDNNKGYIKGNVQIISFRANRLKSNSTAEELLKIANYLQALDRNKNSC